MRFVLAFLLVFSGAAMAQEMPQPLTDTVSDFADLLPEQAEADLTQMLQAAREETGVHIVVVTMGQIADQGGAGQSIETYDKNLFNLWGVGDADRDDGIMVLVARDDGAMRIALGDGFGPVYDGLAQRVIDSQMLPEFREGRFAEGIAAGAQGVIDRLARPYAAKTPPAKPPFNLSDYSDVGLFGLIFGGGLLYTLRRVLGDLVARFRTCPSCGARGLHRHRDVVTPASKTAAGQGLQITRCLHCSHETRSSYTIPRLGSSKSGGGFGGGRSSGGGATGRW